MRPSVDVILGRLSASLLTEVAPLVSVDYVQRNLGLVAMLLGFATEEWDRAVEWRVEENREIRKVLRESASVVTDGALRARLGEAAAGEEGLKVSVLDRANDGLRALLIELHEHVESLDTPAARQVEAAIWGELLASTERRALSLAPF